MKRFLICLILALAPQWAAAQTGPPASGAAGVAPTAQPAPSPETAPLSADPVTVVKTFYPLRPETGPQPFSARLQKLFEAADANSKRLKAPVAGLDFAFQVNAQDTETGYEKTLRFSPRRNDGKRTRVRVSLRNYRAVELAYEMIFENGQWVVDDVRSLREPRWVLSRLYVNGAKEK